KPVRENLFLKNFRITPPGPTPCWSRLLTLRDQVRMFTATALRCDFLLRRMIQKRRLNFTDYGEHDMPRSIWKVAINLHIVHIPVGVVSATSSEGVDFDWLDERSMEPVGYKRVNKVTGKEISREHIVKGVQYEKGRYVVLSDEEIRSAHPKATQTIDIFSFVD